MKLEGASMIITHFSDGDNTAGFKSPLNGLTFTWYHKINCIYYIFRLETPN